MAHFCKLNDEGVVLEVIVVNNAIAVDEAAGVDFLTQWSGGHANWKQTSYNGNIRKQFAGIGYRYNQFADVFVKPQPYPSWALDANHDWQPPVPRPTDGANCSWDESALNWTLG